MNVHRTQLATRQSRVEADVFFSCTRSPEAVAVLRKERFLHDVEADAFFASAWPADRLSRLLDEVGFLGFEQWSHDSESARERYAEAHHEEADREARLRAAVGGRMRHAHWLEEHSDGSVERHARTEERQIKDRERVRRWAAENPDRVRAKRREWEANNAERRAQINHEYYQRNKDRINERQRERNRVNRDRKAEYNRRYRERHPDVVAASNQAWLAKPENRKKHQDATVAWNRRERHRQAAGLPPRRLHRRTAEQIRESSAEAEMFFQRPWSGKEIRQMRKENGAITPPELLAAWYADCDRARLRHRLADDPEFRQRYEERQARERAREKESDEERRMDAIARAINARLRTAPRRRPDIAAPHLEPGTTGHAGISR